MLYIHLTMFSLQAANVRGLAVTVLQNFELRFTGYKQVRMNNLQLMVKQSCRKIIAKRELVH